MIENQEISGLPDNCNSPIYTSPPLPFHQSALDATPPTCFTRRASEKTPHSGPYGVTLPTPNETNMAQAPPRGHMYLWTRHPNIAVSRGKLGRGHVWPRNCGIGSPLASDLGSIFRARETRLFAKTSGETSRNTWYVARLRKRRATFHFRNGVRENGGKADQV